MCTVREFISHNQTLSFKSKRQQASGIWLNMGGKSLNIVGDTHSTTFNYFDHKRVN